MTGLRRILLVEDNQNDIEMTLTALEEYRLGNEVVVVRNGEEALAFLRREGHYRLRAPGHPVVVLLDLKLPKVDGLQVLQQMRESPQLRCVPVVMLTSSREDKDLAAAYRLGANAYVVKPVGFNEFVTAIKEIGLFWAVINQAPPATGAAIGSEP